MPFQSLDDFKKSGIQQKQPSKFNITAITQKLAELYTKLNVGAAKSTLGALNVFPAAAGASLKYDIEKSATPQEYWKRYVGIKPAEEYLEKPKYIAKELGDVLKGNLEKASTTGAYESAFKMAGLEKTKGAKITAPILGFLTDVGVDPLTYLTFGGGSGVKIGEQVLTKAGGKAFGKEVIQNVAKGMTQDIAETTARKTFEGLIKSEGSKFISRGGMRFADWLGGDTILPWSQLKKVIEPFAKYTGVQKIYETLKNAQVTKGITKGLKNAFVVGAEIPQELRQTELLANLAYREKVYKGLEDVVSAVPDLKKISTKEWEQAGHTALYRGTQPELANTLTGKVKNAYDFIITDIGKMHAEVNKLAEEIGADMKIGFINDYMSLVAKENWGKKAQDAIALFGGEIAEHPKTATAAGITRKLEAFEMPRTAYSTAAEAEASGVKLEKNLLKLYSTYKGGINRIKSWLNIVDEAKKFGVPVTEGTKIPTGFVKVSGVLKDYAFPQEIADHFGNLRKAFFGDETVRTLLRGYDKLLGVWKTSATVVSLGGFQLRNGMSNVFNNWIGGLINPIRYGEAARIIANGSGEMGGVAGKTSYDTLRTLMDRWGIPAIYGTWGLDTNPQKLLQGSVGKVMRYLNPATYGRATNAYIENLGRVAMFIDQYAKTGDSRTAALNTVKYMFPYIPESFTAIERNIAKRGIPFYSWLRYNTPLQFEMLFKQPGKYGAIGKFKNLVEAYSEAPDESYMPAWRKEDIEIRLPAETKEGQLYARPDLPYMSLFEILNPTNVLSSITPALKVPAELWGNKSIYTGKPIKAYETSKTDVPGYLALLPQPIRDFLGITEETNKKTGETALKMNPYLAYILQQIPIMSKIGKAIPFEQQSEYQKTNRIYQLISMLFGIGVNPYNAEEAKKSAMKSGTNKTTTKFQSLEDFKQSEGQ